MTETRELEQQLVSLLHYLPSNEAEQVLRALEWATSAHSGKRRKSGHPYIVHPLAVTTMLAELRLDAATLSAALLHDVLEDTPLTYAELADEFGMQVARLVLGVTKLSEKVKDVKKIRVRRGIKLTYEEIEELSLVSLLKHMTKDPRVIVIKLCDRLHNMRTIGALRSERRLEIARETLDLFAPIAGRLGIWLIKKALEDLCLQVIDPNAYSEIKEMAQARNQALARDMGEITAQLQARLAADGLVTTIHPLPEHVYGLYRQMQARGWQKARLYDGLRICVLVDTVPQCYMTFSSIHSLWPPLPGQIADFIATPKDGLYRSLHTVVIGRQGEPLEVRIRTPQMHYLSEYGIIAHLQYPAGGLTPPSSLPQMILLEELGKLLQDKPQDLLKTFISQIAAQFIQVFTPKGDALHLPAGSTPVDFAYAVHTQIGHSCYKALLNGRAVPLNTQLQDGDRVEIIKSETPRPDCAWLDPDLGYVGNPSTLKQIRRWLSRRPEEELYEQGQALIEKEIQRWRAGNPPSGAEIRQMARKRGMLARSLCIRTGRGELSSRDVAEMVLHDLLGLSDDYLGAITLEITAADRPGLLRDACQIVAEDNVNLQRASAIASDEQGQARVQMTLEAQRLCQLIRIAHRLERMTDVLQVYCSHLPTTQAPFDQIIDLPI